MSVIATAVKHLIAAGVTGEALVAAIADMENSLPEVHVEMRSKAAIRQANYRARQASQTITNHNETSQNDTNITPPPSLSPPNENNLTPPIPTPVYINTRARGEFPMLDCTDAETWADFLKNRKAKRLPNTASAYRKLQSDLSAMVARTGWPPGEVFAACVARGWGAIYDPRDKENGNNGRNQNNSGGNGRSIDGFTAALRHVANRQPDVQGFDDTSRMRPVALIGAGYAE